MEGLGFLSEQFFQSESYAVSGDGRTIVGSSFNRAFLAFRWTAATGMVSMGDLPGGRTDSAAWGVNFDGSVIVGYAGSSEGRVAFRWTAANGLESLGDLPGGGVNAEARATSADGSMVVGFGEVGNSNEAFVWTAATGMKGLGTLPPVVEGDSRGSEAYAISADGSVIGGKSNNGGACLWRNGGQPEALKQLLAAQGIDWSALGWSALLEIRGVTTHADRIRVCGLGVRGGSIFTGGKFAPFVAEIDTAPAEAPKLTYAYDPSLRRMTLQVPADFILEGSPSLESSGFVLMQGTGQVTLPAGQTAQYFRLKRKP
jgi:probable HAF family extracellular repeat protein